jgi:hypothetical protein
MIEDPRLANRRKLLHTARGVIPVPPDGAVDGVAIRLRGGPCDGRTGEFLGAYPQKLEINLGTFGVWTYLKTAEFADVEDFRPGTLDKRIRAGRIYEWNGRDPDGHPV